MSGLLKKKKKKKNVRWLLLNISKGCKGCGGYLKKGAKDAEAI